MSLSSASPRPAARGPVRHGVGENLIGTPLIATAAILAGGLWPVQAPSAPCGRFAPHRPYAATDRHTSAAPISQPPTTSESQWTPR